MVRMARARTRGLGSAVSCESAITLARSLNDEFEVGRMDTHFDKGVDGENDKFGLGLRIVHQIQINQLLLFQILRLLHDQRALIDLKLACVSLACSTRSQKGTRGEAALRGRQ